MSDARFGANRWQRWEMGWLDRRDPERSREPSEPAPVRRREDQISMALFDLAKEEAQQKGYEAGHAAGYERGYAEGEAKIRAEQQQAMAEAIDERIAPIAELAQTFRQAAEGLREHMAHQLVELALETGRQLAGRALELKPAHILDDIQVLMEENATLTGTPTLYVNMEDLTLVERHLADTLAGAGWQLRGDVNLARGDCRIETEQLEIDASAADRWARILHAVGHGEH